MFPFALAMMVSAAPAPAPSDITRLFPDKAWIVLGADAQAVRASDLGKKVFGKDSTLTATRKTLTAMFGDEGIGDFKLLAPLESEIDKLQRLTVVLTEKTDASDEMLIFLEGEFDDAKLAAGIEAACKADQRPYRAEKLGERVVRVFGVKDHERRLARIDSATLVVAFTEKSLTGVLDRHSGKTKSDAPKGVVEAVKGIDRKATPLWLIFGANQAQGKMVADFAFDRSITTLALADDAKLTIRIECANEDQANNSKTVIDVLAGFVKGANDKPLMQDWGRSQTTRIEKNVVTSTGTFRGTTLAEEYAKVK